MIQFTCNLAEREKLSATCRDITEDIIDRIVPEQMTIAKIRELIKHAASRGSVAGLIQGAKCALSMPAEDQDAVRASEGIEVYSPSKESIARELREMATPRSDESVPEPLKAGTIVNKTLPNKYEWYMPDPKDSGKTLHIG